MKLAWAALCCGLTFLLLAGAAMAQPNVVVVMTDDQTTTDLRFMPKVKRLGQEGTEFRNAFASYPLCCPSRATFLTGQHAHNTGVMDNGDADELDESETLPVWLQRAGYRTSFVGKYLNGYAGGTPPGWTNFVGAMPVDLAMFDYPLSVDGVKRTYGDDRDDYKTDVLADFAVDAVRDLSGPGPFFLTFAPTAPHGEPLPDDAPRNPRPAPRHLGDYDDEMLPRPPNYDEADVSDKPAHVRSLRRLDGKRRKLTAQHRGRIESLLAVDQAVNRIKDALSREGELDDTLLVFTSDNGYLMGQHRIISSKRYPYEESARVPLILRGPGVPAGVRREQLVANVDLATTIVDAADAQAGVIQDGRSLLPLLTDPLAAASRDLLLEGRLEGKAPEYSAVRDREHLYVDWSTGEKELYDLDRDPYQLENVVSDNSYGAERAALKARLEELRSCIGAECHGAP